MILRAKFYNYPIDIFAVGCILAEIITFRPLFAGDNEIDQLSKIVAILGTPTKDSWPEGETLCKKMNIKYESDSSEIKPMNLSLLFKDGDERPPHTVHLLSSLLTLNPKARPTAKEALEFDFFEDKANLPQSPAETSLRNSNQRLFENKVIKRQECEDARDDITEPTENTSTSFSSEANLKHAHAYSFERNHQSNTYETRGIIKRSLSNPFEYHPNKFQTSELNIFSSSRSLFSERSSTSRPTSNISELFTPGVFNEIKMKHERNVRQCNTTGLKLSCQKVAEDDSRKYMLHDPVQSLSTPVTYKDRLNSRYSSGLS